MIKQYVNVAVAGLLLMVGVGTNRVGAAGTEEQRRDFQTIAAQLDPGGELFLVLSAGRWIDRMLKSLAEGATGMPAGEPEDVDVRESLEHVRRFLNRQGMGGLRGLGASSVARPDGRHDIKLFLLRDVADSSLPCWRGLFGWQPRRLLSLDFVPAGFSMVRAGTVEPMVLWQMLGDGVQEAGSAAAKARLAALREALKARLGIPMEDLLGSLRDELLVAVRFDKQATCTLPTGTGGTLTIPAPSFLVVVATGEDVLRGVVEAQLSRRGLTLAESVVAGERLRSAEGPLEGAPLPLHPAFASLPGFFLFGSSPAVVEEALLAYRHRNGLVSRPEFQNAFQGLSMVNNGILYADAEAAQILRHWRESLVETGAAAGDDTDPIMERLYKEMSVFGGELPACALVVQNWKNGVMVMGSAGAGGEVLLKQAGVAALHLWDQLWRRVAALPPPQ